MGYSLDLFCQMDKRKVIATFKTLKEIQDHFGNGEEIRLAHLISNVILGNMLNSVALHFTAINLSAKTT